MKPSLLLIKSFKFNNFRAAATITITDDDPTPSLAVNGSNLAEAATNLNFTVTLSGQSSQTVTANYATSNGSATAGQITLANQVL